MSKQKNEGTLVELTWRCEGNTKKVIDAIAGGYRLTGMLRGRESELLGDAGRRDGGLLLEYSVCLSTNQKKNGASK